MQRLPESVVPELRGRWVKLVGAREVVQGAAREMQRIEKDYQELLNTCLRVMGLDPAVNYKVNLESGEISEVTAADVVRDGSGSVPFVAPTTEGQN